MISDAARNPLVSRLFALISVLLLVAGFLAASIVSTILAWSRPPLRSQSSFLAASLRGPGMLRWSLRDCDFSSPACCLVRLLCLRSLCCSNSWRIFSSGWLSALADLAACTKSPAIEAAQDGERDDDPAVLVALVASAQQVVDIADDVHELAVRAGIHWVFGLLEVAANAISAACLQRDRLRLRPGAATALVGADNCWSVPPLSSGSSGNCGSRFVSSGFTAPIAAQRSFPTTSQSAASASASDLPGRLMRTRGEKAPAKSNRFTANSNRLAARPRSEG